ncbi:MAG: antiterminator Q family protein [Pseudomonadota bacterium]
MRTPVISKVTEYYLQQWGRWQRWLLTQGLGYPSESSINKLVRGKGLYIRSTASHLQPEDAVVRLIDQTIVQLERQNKQAVRLLYYHYLKPNSLRHKAEVLKLSYSSYRETLYRASYHIQQALKQVGLVK